MIYLAHGYQGAGKTAFMVAKMLELCTIRGYSPEECFGNVAIRAPGYTCLNNQGLRNYISMMLRNGLRHKVILIDEIDQVFPARYWNSGEQTETLIGLWQDEKLFNRIICTEHTSETGTDKVIRDAAQVDIYPEVREDLDLLICNALYNPGIPINYIHRWTYKFSWVIQQYDRWQLIK